MFKQLYLQFFKALVLQDESLILGDKTFEKLSSCERVITYF